MNKWYMITIDDPEFLSGKSIYDTIVLLLKNIEFKYVILNDIVGTGMPGAIPSLINQEDNVMDLHDFLRVLPDVKQFEWGDFFLFKEYPKGWDHPEKCDYTYLLPQSNTVVRAIDNQYIYIYTPIDSIVQIIKKNYQIESFKFDVLENLDYPY